MALCVWGLFMNVDAQWAAGWLLASHTLGCVEHNLYQGWSYQFVSGQVESEASEGSQYWRG